MMYMLIKGVSHSITCGVILIILKILSIYLEDTILTHNLVFHRRLQNSPNLTSYIDL